MSKTVKRVSETVKRVMRVMMVGLVAMLGVEAEAHWYVAGGKPRVCSHCVDAELRKDHEKHDFEHTEEADFHLMTKRVDLLCPTQTGVSTVPSTREVRLVVQKLIVPGDATYYDVEIGGDRNPLSNAQARFDLVAEFSDSALKDALPCPGGLPPIDVLIRETAIKIVTYSCTVVVDSTGSRVRKCEPFDTFERGSCTLNRFFNFNIYPPIGTPYVCLR